MSVTQASIETRTRLLLVEDDVDQQELISEVLEDAFGQGCVDVLGTCRAVDAIGHIDDYGLALLDVNLPDGNGLDLLAKIRQRTPTLPIMMLTGENDTALAKQAIRGGACDYVVKAGAYLETMPLTIEKNLAAGLQNNERASEAKALRDNLANEKAARETAEREASVDAMTGCYNRRAFERLGSSLFSEAYRNDSLLSMVMIDLDKFKQVNDTLGHAVGDDLIRTAARSILANMRQMDVACRYGGDEFVLLLPHTASQQAAGVAERISADFGLATAAMLPDAQPRTMSLGVAELQASQPRLTNLEGLMVACDRSLYQAKESGRAQVCIAA